MTSQRKRDETAEWRAWVRTHRATLDRLGIPEEAYRTKLDWFQFLDHGYVQSGSKRLDDWWRIGWLAPDDARALAELIHEEYGEQYSDLIQRLNELARRDSGRATD